MASQVQDDPFQRLFKNAQSKFRDGLAAKKCDPSVYPEVLRTETMGQVQLALEELQRKQKSREGWLHLERISPLLDRLQSFAVVVNQFVQVKPDILALIWGPITLFMLWSSELRGAYNAFIDITLKLGQVLPQFEDVAKIFVDQDRIKEYLLLLYKDILDFHLAALSLFSKPTWKILFHTLWNLEKEKFQKIEENIHAHVGLLRDETTFEHIRRAHSHAQEALKNFDEIKGNQRRQLFQALEVEIRPKLYVTKLDWLRNRACDGTATWLLGNDTFRKWLTFAAQSPKHIWLQGIPGAGKTFLAYQAINEAQKTAAAKTIYLFASYRDESINALSMVHSLLFQIAVDSADLQTALVDTNERGWRNSLIPAAMLLQKAVEVVGPLFVVIDGLDEVEDFERKLFLQRLLQISATGRELKICVSSRRETDIERLFATTADSILVHDNNAASIHAYSQSRFKEWMSERMFLYARIVIDNVKLLNDVSEIMRELRALPEDYTEAYARVLRRIDSLPPARYQRARRILAWIQCSPILLTILEMEQALLVTADRDDAPIVESSLDMLAECGPIVELVDDIPQFVHFTVKEYISDDKTEGQVDITPSTFDLLNTCVTYLSYKAFNNELSDIEVERNITSGRYRFARFAASYWFQLVRCYIALSDGPSCTAKLAGILDELAEKRKNCDFMPCPNEKKNQLSIFRKWPKLLEFFSRMLDFEADERRDSWTVTKGANWLQHDPTTLSGAMVRIESYYEELLITVNHKLNPDRRLKITLETEYGKRLSKCHYLSCPVRLTGFTIRQDCERHIQCHDRPFKCTMKGCPWSELGFYTRSDLQKHKMWHAKMASPIEASTALPEKEELYPLLFELVENEDIQELEKIWQSCKKVIQPHTASRLIAKAAARGSLSIVQLIVDVRPFQREEGSKLPPIITDPTDPDFRLFLIENGGFPAYLDEWIKATIESNNTELTKWLLEEATAWFNSTSHIARTYPVMRYDLVVANLMHSPYLETLRIWKDIIFRLDEIYIPRILRELTRQCALTAAFKNPVNEMELLEIWQQFTRNGKIDEKYLGQALNNVAKYGQSVQLAEGLLKLGAPIDFPQRPRSSGYRKGMTALHHATSRTSAQAAELTKLLLLHGADYDLGYGVYKPRDGAGAHGISKWLDMDWKQLIDWVKEERARRRRRGESARSSNAERPDSTMPQSADVIVIYDD